MASSALKSALRFTACMQAVNLKIKLRLRFTGAVDDQSGAAAQLPAYQGLEGRLRAGPSATISRTSATAGWPLQAGAPAGPARSGAKALRWDILPSRSLADWRSNMVAPSSATSQSIVSSIIDRPRRIIGIACCRAANSGAGAADAEAAALPASSSNAARSPNDPPMSKAAIRRAIGKPTSCCSPDMAKACSSSTSDTPASASCSSARSKGRPDRTDHRPPTRHTSAGAAQNHQLRQRNRVRRTSQAAQRPWRPNLLLRSP